MAREIRPGESYAVVEAVKAGGGYGQKSYHRGIIKYGKRSIPCDGDQMPPHKHKTAESARECAAQLRNQLELPKPPRMEFGKDDRKRHAQRWGV